MDVDTTQLRALAVDLGKAEAVALPKVRAIVQKTMLDTKNDLKAEASAGGPSGARLSSTITYDTKFGGDGISAEVGPVKGGAGSLALLYYGNSKTGPVLKDPMFAMVRNAAKAEPFFVKALGDVL